MNRGTDIRKGGRDGVKSSKGKETNEKEEIWGGRKRGGRRWREEGRKTGGERREGGLKALEPLEGSSGISTSCDRA